MRNRLLGAALLGFVAIAAAASPAAADNYPVRDGAGVPQTFCSRLISAVQWPCHLMFGLNGSTPTAVTIDGSGNLDVNVQVSALPSGAATAANQASANTKLDSTISAINAMAAKLPATLGVQASAASVSVTPASDAIFATRGVTASTTTDRSITVTTGGAAQLVMALNTSRRSFYVFNPNSSGTCWGSITSTTPAANALGSFPLPSLGGFGMEANATTAALYVNCPATGQFITAWESQ